MDYGGKDHQTAD